MSFQDQKAYMGVTQRLSRAILSERLSHAYIIEGDSISGKKSFAMDFAKAILCREKPGEGCDSCKTCRMIDAGTYRDLYLVEADERSVKQGQIEELQERVGRNPVEEAGRNIAIISDSDTMTSRAQNRLLKTLEEPNPGTVIMLLSENSENLLRTIRSRCQSIRLYGGGDAELSPEMEKQQELARRILKLIDEKKYFYEKKSEIEKVKDKRSALMFLDFLEGEFRNVMIQKSSKGISSEREIESIKLIEKTREDIRYNVKERYALCDLVLKLEDC